MTVIVNTHRNIHSEVHREVTSPGTGLAHDDLQQVLDRRSQSGKTYTLHMLFTRHNQVEETKDTRSSLSCKCVVLEGDPVAL